LRGDDHHHHHHHFRYDAWKTEHVKRYVANNHRLVGGVLFDQKRNELRNCSEVLTINWASVGTGNQVVTALTEDASCPTGAIEVATAGTDPTFQARRTSHVTRQQSHGHSAAAEAPNVATR
jgi:hypothetical protein